MDNKGFTLAEYLGCVALLAVVLIIGFCAGGYQLSASLKDLRPVDNNEVFEAARAYATNEDVNYIRDKYMCVKVSTLVDTGYLEDTNDELLKERLVKVTKNKKKKILVTSYVDKCK